MAGITIFQFIQTINASPPSVDFCNLAKSHHQICQIRVNLVVAQLEGEEARHNIKEDYFKTIEKDMVLVNRVLEKFEENLTKKKVV